MARKNGNFIPGKVTRIKMPKSTGSWLTNAGKSLGLATMDILSDVMPASIEVAQNAGEFAMNFKDHLRDMRTKSQQMKQAMDKNVYMDIAKTAVKNSLADFKSGNLYTEMKYDDGFGDMDDFDFGDDSSWDVGDDSDYDASFSSEDGMTHVATSHSRNGDVDNNIVNVNVDIGNNSRLAKAMDRQTQVATDNAKVALEYNKAFNRTLLADINRIGEAQSGYLQSIDSNMSAIVQIGDVISKTSAVATKYYDDSMSVFNNIYTTLNDIKTSMTSGAGGSITGDSKRFEGKYKNVLDDVFSSNGIINLDEYGKVVQKQLKNALAGNIFTSTIMNAFSDTDALKAILEHPLNHITKWGINKFIPEMMKEAAGSFDKMLQESMVTLLHRMRGMRDDTNPLIAFLGETFGIGNSLYTTVNKSNYNKGKVDWNGESHKTLNEVIPYYLRIIAASVSGQEEMGFDYEKGVFRKVSDMRKEYRENDERNYLSEFSSVISDFKEALSKNVTFEDKKQSEETVKAMQRFLISQVKKDGTKARRKNGSFRDFIAEEMGTDVNDTYVQLISAYLDNMSNSEVAALFGRNMLDARANFSRRKIQEETGELATNVRYVDNGLVDPDTGLKKDKKGNVTGVNYKMSPFIERDKYGKTNLTYLRDIYKLLLEGIIVYPINNASSGGGNGGNSDYSRRITKLRERASGLDNDYLEGYRDPNAGQTPTDLTPEQIANAQAHGRVVISRITGDGEGDAYRQMSAAERNRQAENKETEQKESLFAQLTGIDPNKPISKIINGIVELTKEPGKIGTKLFEKADDFLFKLVFGDSEKDGTGVFRKAMAYVKSGIKGMALWVNNKILEPLQEHLFGDNGLFTQLKQTKLFEAFKGKASAVRDAIFGMKQSDGSYAGGIVSDLLNGIKDVTINRDNPDSIVSNMIDMGKSAANGIADTIFGTDRRNRRNNGPNYSPVKAFVDDVYDRMKEHVSTISDALFGPPDPGTFSANFKQDMQNMGGPKLAAGAGVGIIGSFFLPGGPLLGALLGVGATITKNSETLQRTLFGEVGDDGTRQGNIISKEIIDAVGDNKAEITIGAGIGLLPSFFLPGGPITGALLGMASGMVFKSKVMQDFLFGNENKEGVLGKVKNIFKNADGTDNRARFLDTGIGAGLGLVGSFFLPGGPVLGAIAGGAAGFGFGSEAFQEFLFGPKGQDGKRTGGALTKITKSISETLKPGLKKIQNGFMEFVERKMIIPLVAGLKPIINFGKNIVTTVTNTITGAFKFVGKSVTTFLIGDKKSGKKGILSPLVNVVSGAMKLTGKLAQNIVSAPFKLIAAVGKTLDLGTRVKNMVMNAANFFIAPFLSLGKNMLDGVKKFVSDKFKTWKENRKKKKEERKKRRKERIANAKQALKDRFASTKIGGAITRGLDKARKNTNAGKTGKIGNWLNTISTNRYKWVMVNGKPKFVKDDSYEYTNTKSGMSVAKEENLLQNESEQWWAYRNAFNGGKDDMSKAKKYFEKLGYSKETMDKLFNGQGPLKRKKFDQLLNHKLSIGQKGEKAEAKIKEKRIEKVANKLVTQDFQTNNLVANNLTILGAKSLAGEKTQDAFKFRAQAENKLQGVNSQIARYQEELAQAEASGASEDKINIIKKKIENAQEKANTLQGAIDESKNQLSDERYNELKQNVDSRLKKITKTIKNLNKELAKYEQENVKLTEDLAQAEASGANENQIKSIKRKIESNNQKIKDTKNKISKLQAEYNALSGGRNPIPGTTAQDIQEGRPIPPSGQGDSGQRAFGGKIKKTGKYWLSKGETVIPNGGFGSKLDFLKEKALKFASEKGGFKDFINDDGEVFDVETGTHANKSAGEQAAEGVVARNKKRFNFEKFSEMKQKLAEKAEEAKFRDKLLSGIEIISEKVGTFSNKWSSIFGKKGLLLLGILAVTKLFPGLVDKVGNILKTAASWAGDVFKHFNDAFKAIGGFEGLGNNVGELVTSITNLLFPDKNEKGQQTKKQAVIDEKGVVQVDENGNIIYENVALKKNKNHLQRLNDFVFAPQTKIDVDGSVTGTPGAAYIEQNTYDGTSGRKLMILSNGVRKITNGVIGTGRGINKITGGALGRGVDKLNKFAGNVVNKGVTTTLGVGQNVVEKGFKGYGADIAKAYGKSSSKYMANAAQKAGSTAANAAFTEAVGSGASRKVASRTAQRAFDMGVAQTMDDVGVKTASKMAGIKGAINAATHSTISEAVDASNKGLIGTFLEYFKKALGFLKDKVTAFATKHGFKLPSAVTQLFNKFGKEVNESAIGKLGKVIINKISAALGKAAASAATFLLSDVGFAVTGGLIGAANIENTFKADLDKLSFGARTKLRLISGLFRAFATTSLGTMLDIGCLIIYMLSDGNFDIIMELAMLLFRIWCEADGTSNQIDILKQSQDEFRTQYDNYVTKEYEAYKANAEANGESYLDKESFIQQGLVTSFDDYNAEQHKTVGKKIWDGVTGVGKGIAKGAKTVTGAIGGAVKSVGTGIKNVGTSIANSKVGKFVGGVAQGVGNAITGVTDKVGQFFGSAIDVGKVVVNDFTKKVLPWAISAQDKMQPIEVADKNDKVTVGLISAMRLITSNMLKPVRGITSFVKGAAKLIESVMGPVMGVAKDLGGNISQSFASVQSFRDTDFMSGGAYWNNNSEAGTLGGILGNVVKTLLLPAAQIKGATKDVGAFIGKAIGAIMGVATDIGGNISQSIANVHSISDTAFGGAYWENNSEAGTIGNIAGTAAKLLILPAAQIKGVAGSVMNVIENFKAGLAVMGQIKADSLSKVTGFSSILPGGAYWENDIESDNALVNIGVFGTKLFTLFSAVPQAVAYEASEGVLKPMVDSLKDTGAAWSEGFSIKTDLFTNGSIGDNLKNFMKSPTLGNKSGFAARAGSFGFYLGRMMTFIPSMLSSAFNWIYKAITENDLIQKGLKFFAKLFGSKDGLDEMFDVVETEETTSGNGTLSGNGDAPSMKNGFPYYSQKDSDLRNKPYRVSKGMSMYDENMGTRGCGPTALAMVASKLKGGFGNNYSPENMARLAEQGGYSTNSGTTPNYFTEVGSRLGMNVTPATASPNNIAGMLGSGQPVILQGQSSDSSSPFTSSGHYVVGVGMDRKGNVLVNDPNGRSKSKSYSMRNLTKGANLAFGFSNGGFGPAGYNGMPTYVQQTMEVQNNKARTKKYGYNGMPTYVQQTMEVQNNRTQWINVIRLVKSVIAAYGCGYSDPDHPFTREMDFNGKKLTIRPDCSGFVTTCLVLFGVLPENKVLSLSSYAYTDANNSTLKQTGFVSSSWNGWDSLQEGDIIATNGHVEIFCENDSNGRHKVYNCGSNESTNNPNPTNSGHKSYTTVWKLGSATGANALTDVTNVSTSSVNYSTSGTSTESGNSGKASSLSGALSNFASALLSPVKKFLYGSDGTDSSSSGSYSSSGATSGVASPITGTIVPVDPINADPDLKKLTKDSFAQSDIKTIPKLTETQIKTILDTSFTNKGGIFNSGNTALSANGIYRAQQDTGISALVPLAIGAQESGWGTSSIARNKGNMWGWGAYNSSPGESAVDFGSDPYNSFKGYTNAFLNKYYNEYGAKSIYSAGTGTNPAGKGYAYSDSGVISTSWVDGVSGCAKGMLNRLDKAGGLGDARPRYNVIDNTSRGGFGSYSIDNVVNKHDQRVQRTGGFGDASNTEVIGLLTSMLAEMKGTNDGINKFNDKDFSGMGGNTVNYFDNKTNNNIDVNQSRPSQPLQKPSAMVDPNIYNIAKQISAGTVMV